MILEAPVTRDGVRAKPSMTPCKVLFHAEKTKDRPHRASTK